MFKIYVSKSIILIEEHGLYKESRVYLKCDSCVFDKVNCMKVMQSSGGVSLCRRLQEFRSKVWSDDKLRIERLSDDRHKFKASGLIRMTSIYIVKYFNHGRIHIDR